MTKRFSLPASLLVLSGIGMAALLLSTRWGIGLSPDSALYIGAARNLLSGNGLSVSSYAEKFTPLTQYPPLFSSVLAGIGLFGVEPAHGVRWLHVLLLAGNIFLVGLMVRTYSRSRWVSVLASFLMMTSVAGVKIHSMAWSEPLFIFLELLALFLLAQHFEHQRVLFLVVSAVTAALAFLTRYAGVALVATGALAILLLSKEKWKKRSTDTVLFCLISAVPTALWMIRNLLIAGTTTARDIGFHPITVGHFQSAFNSVSSWLLPGAIPFARGVSLLIVVALFAFIFLVTLRKGERNQKECGHEGLARLSMLLAIFVGMYGLMLIIVISFFDAYMPIDDRYLSPVYVPTLVLVLCLSSYFFSALVKARAVHISLVVFSLALSGLYLAQAISWLTLDYKNGIGYSSRSWKQSKLIAQVKALDPKTPIFTNAPDAVYLLTGLPAYMIPRKVDPATKKANGDFSSQLAAVRDQLVERKGVVVYFQSIIWRWYLPSEDELKEKLSLQAIAQEGDGSISQIRHVGKD